ncbi:MAG: hypothetical protein ABI647_25995 [Gemmatimonadota bacterium]
MDEPRRYLVVEGERKPERKFDVVGKLEPRLEVVRWFAVVHGRSVEWRLLEHVAFRLVVQRYEQVVRVFHEPELRLVR